MRERPWPQAPAGTAHDWLRPQLHFISHLLLESPLLHFLFLMFLGWDTVDKAAQKKERKGEPVVISYVILQGTRSLLCDSTRLDSACDEPKKGIPARPSSEFVGATGMHVIA